MTDKAHILKKHRLQISTIIIILSSLTIVLLGLWFALNKQSNPYLVIHPRTLRSLVAIIPASFFHGSIKHLLGNVAGLWISGFLALYLEGTRALKGLLAGLVVCGVAQWIFGMPGAVHMGFSGGIFALLAVALISSIRSNNVLWILGTCVVLYLGFGESIVQTLMPTEYTTENNISWLAHLGGFIGGIWYQTRSRTIALQVLLEDDLINVEEYKLIARRMADTSNQTPLAPAIPPATTPGTRPASLPPEIGEPAGVTAAPASAGKPGDIPAEAAPANGLDGKPVDAAPAPQEPAPQ